MERWKFPAKENWSLDVRREFSATESFDSMRKLRSPVAECCSKYGEIDSTQIPGTYAWRRLKSPPGRRFSSRKVGSNNSARGQAQSGTLARLRARQVTGSVPDCACPLAL